jgi:hypothetical protein
MTQQGKTLQAAPAVINPLQQKTIGRKEKLLHTASNTRYEQVNYLVFHIVIARIRCQA